MLKNGTEFVFIDLEGYVPDYDEASEQQDMGTQVITEYNLGLLWHIPMSVRPSFWPSEREKEHPYPLELMSHRVFTRTDEPPCFLGLHGVTSAGEGLTWRTDTPIGVSMIRQLASA